MKLFVNIEYYLVAILDRKQNVQKYIHSLYYYSSIYVKQKYLLSWSAKQDNSFSVHQGL